MDVLKGKYTFVITLQSIINLFRKEVLKYKNSRKKTNLYYLAANSNRH